MNTFKVLLPFLIKTNQRFISELGIQYILWWNIYHLLNHAVDCYYTLFLHKKHLFCRKIIMKTVSFSFSLGRPSCLILWLSIGSTKLSVLYKSQQIVFIALLRQLNCFFVFLQKNKIQQLSKVVLLLWIIYVISVLFCYAFMYICLLMPCGHLLGKGWPLGSRLWCSILRLSLPRWYPGSGVVLDCIDSWSLPSFLLSTALFKRWYPFHPKMQWIINSEMTFWLVLIRTGHKCQHLKLRVYTQKSRTGI